MRSKFYINFYLQEIERKLWKMYFLYKNLSWYFIKPDNNKLFKSIAVALYKEIIFNQINQQFRVLQTVTFGEPENLKINIINMLLTQTFLQRPGLSI